MPEEVAMFRHLVMRGLGEAGGLQANAKSKAPHLKSM
jgi:hypothetical protein